jgi:hypothetical protein
VEGEKCDRRFHAVAMPHQRIKNHFEDALPWRWFYPSVIAEFSWFFRHNQRRPRIEVASSELAYSIYMRAISNKKSHRAPGFVDAKWIMWIPWKSCIEN